MDNNKRTEKHKKGFKFRLNIKVIGLFIAFEILFTAITAPLILIYGPFTQSKKMFIGTANNSMHFKWLATTFISQDKINELLGLNVDYTTEVVTQDTSLVNIPTVKDETIVRQNITGSSYTGYVLIINDPTRVKVGISSKIGSEGETTSQIAINNNAVAAINGGAFASDPDQAEWTQNGGTPTGVLISNGKVVFDDLAGKKSTVAAITNDGRLLAGAYTTQELLQKNVVEALSFDPVLIQNGIKIDVPGTGTSPRTLIGQRADGAIVMVVLDSKSGTRVAATTQDAQDVMAKLGCMTAINLDGGKSTTMYYNGEVINNPSFALGERAIISGFIVK